MDSLTQATLGAAIGQAVLGKKIGYKTSTVLGAIIGTVPDLDVVFVPFFSALQRISLHRGLSHSLIFCLLGAFLFALILKKMKWTHQIRYIILWVFSFLALFTHVLLDSFTTYGTQLFLPFSNLRVSFDSIGIIDPAYTLPLFVGVILSFILFKRGKKKPNLPNTIGLIVSTIYLLFTLTNKQHINHVFHAQMDDQNINSQKLLTVPVKLGNVMWYGVAKDDHELHIGLYSILKRNKIEFHSFPIHDELLSGLDENLVEKMKWFAQDFYTVAEHDGKIRIYNLQCDMQGIREIEDYKAPTAFYFEIAPGTETKTYQLSSGMHHIDNED